jgi:glycosyltransferase involved in cell wall biosynthesis
MLLSVLVPTKNNPDTLIPLVKGFASWSKENSDNVELVIVDNSDVINDNINNFSFTNVRYVWSNEQIDMLQNFDKCVGLALGDFSIIIGDDDAVLPSILEVAKEISGLGVDSAMSIAGVYYWPGVNSYWEPNNTSGYFMDWKSPKPPSNYNVEGGLDKLLRSGGCSYKSFLPSAYHGIVKTKILQSLIEKYGTAFPGPSPDISNAVLLGLSNVTCRFYSSFMVSGARIGSASAEGALHGHHGELAERLSYINRGTFSWPSTVPGFFCGPTMWSVSVLYTLKFAGASNHLHKLNSAMLHGSCLVFHPTYFSLIMRSLLKQRSGVILAFPVAVGRSVHKRVAEYVSNYLLHSPLLNRFSSKYVMRGIHDTKALVDILGKRKKRAC